jgi:TonB-dependent SusC/RagA subfamily outer membrane receptor
MLLIASYLLKVIICSGILYGYYWLLLRNKVFHKYNRFYLMAVVVLSLLLPLIKINFWQPAPEQTTGVMQVLQVVSNSDEYMDNIIVSASSNSFDITQLYPLAYLIVSLVLFIILLHTLYSIFNLIKKYPTQIIDKISFVNTDAKSTPFSFFNYIFWNNSIDIETTTGHQIFKHELAHVQEKHSHDKIFINSILIFFWCNPFFWLIRKELNMIHEFIADKKAVEDSDTASFAAMILQATYPQHRFHLTNNFFYSPIKRRLLMLTKNKNPKINYFGRVMALPLLVLIFAAFTFKVKNVSSTKAEITAAEKNNGNKLQQFKDTVPVAMFMNTKHADTNYFKTDAFKNKALVIIDSKEIGNLGYNYLEKNTASFTTAVIYNPEKAMKVYGAKGKYGVIKLTQKDAILISADTVFFDKKNNSVKLSGNKTVVSGDLSNTLIYIDGKISTPEQLNTIPPDKISNVTVLKGDKLDDIIDAKGKTAMINVTLKADDLPEVTVQSKQATPLYVVDGKVKEDNFNINTISPDIIESVNVLKGNSATLLYGEKGKNGVVEIKTKNKNEVIVQGYKKTVPLYIIDGKESTKENADKINPERIEEVRVIKETTALEVYGAKGKNGVVIINLKPEKSPPYINSLTSYGDLNNQGASPYFEVNGKEYSGYTLVKYMKETGIEHFDEIKMYDKIEGLKKFGAKAGDGAIIVSIKTDNTFKVFTKTEIDPFFSGGDDGWRKYLMKNLNPDIPLNEGWKAGTYTIVVQFIVHADGTVSDVSTTNYQNSKTAQHCIDLIKQSPNWKPAIQNGRPVNAYRKQPITFVVEGDKKSVTATF